MSSSKSARASFVENAVARLRNDPRVEAVLVAGSAITRSDDAFSDVDLVIVCRDADHAATMDDRHAIAASLGLLLAAFTGEHVGEPRLLICLYDAPLLHVDLKFVTRAALAQRVETPLVAFDRDGTMDTTLRAGTAEWPAHPPEWFEERFWIWVHYGATKIGRGELFEAHDLLTFVRAQVLGPMIARHLGQPQRGVRRIELDAAAHVPELAQTVARYDRGDCWRALEVTVELYRRYRNDRVPQNLRPERERAVLAYVADTRERAS